ncbi:MAG: polysaccharide biosynthesis/export family protein [Myxococcota bacterium]
MVQDDSSLGVSDIFSVRVYGEEELSGTYQVGSSGSFVFPFIGELNVAGMQPFQVAERIAEGLRAEGYLQQPQVTVLVEEYNSKKISIVGEVRNPGSFQISSGLTVAQAVSLAGGFTNIADENSTVVTRKVDGSLRRFRVPVREVTRGRTEDFLLQSGDLIYVPQRVF